MAITWMGIDGGGSNLRVTIVDNNLNELVTVQGDAANPGAIGHEEAKIRIQNAVRQALTQSGNAGITGVGIGIAGASAEHSADWLHDVLIPVLPDAKIHASSDVEIALVGGRGTLHGLVLLAGTGSIAYGRTQDGQTHRAGGWGYLLGDEGSGYWIGLQALKSVTHARDKRISPLTNLPQAILKTLMIDARDIVRWTYHQSKPADIAQLTQIVLDHAEHGDTLAISIIDQAAYELALLAANVQDVLNLSVHDITFAGGLLTSDNVLSRAVTRELNFTAPPQIHYSPVVGAALFAKLNEDK